MGLHQDKDEAALDAPVVSVSLGDDAVFRIGGDERGGPTKSLKLALRRCGDVRRPGAAGLSRHRPHPARHFDPVAGRRPHQPDPAARDVQTDELHRSDRPAGRTSRGVRRSAGPLDAVTRFARRASPKKRRPAIRPGAQMRRYARWMPGGDTGIRRKRGPLASGGQCVQPSVSRKQSLCIKDTHFNYFLLKRILDNFSLVRTIFAIVVRAGISPASAPAKPRKQGPADRIPAARPFRDAIAPPAESPWRPAATPPRSARPGHAASPNRPGASLAMP